jgi:uncharacterized protein (TIGR02466 family)
MRWDLIQSNYLNLSEEQRQAIINHIYSVKEVDSGRYVSNEGGWQCAAKQDDCLEELYKQVTSISNNYMSELNGASVKIYESWYNINPTGAYNTAHRHGFIGLSAVVYLQVEDGNINFHDFTGTSDALKIPNLIRKVPNNLEMVLFPSNYIHSVSPNNAQTDRISIAINMSIHK